MQAELNVTRPKPLSFLARLASAKVHLHALALYTLLSLLYTWPLAARFSTHMPGDGGDDPALAWNLWWIKHRLIDQVNFDIFHVDYMFYPIEINLAFYTLTPLNGLLSVPLQTAWDLLPANNLILLMSFVLGGYGTFLLLSDLLRRTPLHSTQQATALSPRATATIAFLGGLFYAFASAKLFYPALGQFNIASSHWIPFCALYLLRMVFATETRVRYRAATLAGLFLAFQAWAELTYASFLIIFAALVYCWWLLRLLSTPANQPGGFGALVWSGLIFGGVFAVGIAPFLAAMLPDMRVEGDFFGEGGGFADIFSADLMGYLFPTMLHPWLGEWARGLPFPNDKGQQIYIGYTLTLLGGLGAWSLLRRPRTETAAQSSPHVGVLNPRGLGLFWLVSALLFFLLTLGPHVRWAGVDLPIVGPFEWISRLPFFSGNRYPSRYGVMLLLSVSVLAAYGMAWLALRTHAMRRARGWAFALAVTVLFSAEHISAPLPLNDARVPAVYQTLAQQPGDFAVLELPTGWRNGARIVGRLDQVIMMQQWYQTVHEKRRLGGNTSRNPAYKFQYFSEAPLLGDLIALMNADRDHIAAEIEPQLDALIARHQPTAPQVLYDLGVRYILLHTETRRAPPALQRFVEETLPLTLVESWEGVDWASEPAGIRLYALDFEPAAADGMPATRTVDLTEPAGNLYLAEGWSARYEGTNTARLAHRTPIDLLLPYPAHATQASESPIYRVSLAVRADTDNPGYHLQAVAWNGIRLNDWELVDNILTVTLPPEVPTHAGHTSTAMQRLTLHFEENRATTSLSAAGPSEIGATGVELEPGVSLLARSAGEEVGNFAHVYINGQDYAPNTIGYNLVAFTREGDMLDAAAFDTHGDPAAASRLVAWLDQWSPGTVIAGAVADEGSRQLSEEAVHALARVGVAIDLRNRLRWSHAFIGVVGAPPETALEASVLIAPAAVGIGMPQENSEIYGGIEALSWP